MPTELIVALDFDEASRYLACLDQLDPQYCAVKIGSELFTRLGPRAVTQCIQKGFRVFLDLKFHDIPSTVAKAVAAAADLGVWMVNVHALGGSTMLRAAREALLPFEKQRPLLIAVSVLTSFDEPGLRELGLEQVSVAQQVLRLAALAHEAGLDGMVCSGQEVSAMKSAFGSTFLAVTPGIRLASDAVNDQVRVLSPMEAKLRGSDYLVIGRSLTTHAQPGQQLMSIYRALNGE